MDDAQQLRLNDTRLDAHDAAVLQASAEQRRVMQLWTVFEKPDDYPEAFVARPTRIMRGLPPMPLAAVLLADTLPALREQLPPWLTRMGPMGPDEPEHLVETWL